MGWFTAALAIGSAVQGGSAIRKAGAAARREASMQAAQYRRQKFDVALLATQQHESRMEQFKDFASYNEAMAAFMGRTGRSLSALRKEEERRYGRDVDRIRMQEKREKQKLEETAKVTEASGIAAGKAYKEQAKGSLLTGAIRAAELYG
jgi:hypothetical protein